MVENIRIKTSSAGVIPRMIYFAYALLMYNMWVYANVELTQSRRGGEPIIAQITFLKTLMMAMFKIRPESEPPP